MSEQEVANLRRSLVISNPLQMSFQVFCSEFGTNSGFYLSVPSAPIQIKRASGKNQYQSHAGFTGGIIERGDNDAESHHHKKYRYYRIAKGPVRSRHIGAFFA